MELVLILTNRQLMIIKQGAPPLANPFHYNYLNYIEKIELII